MLGVNIVLVKHKRQSSYLIFSIFLPNNKQKNAILRHFCLFKIYLSTISASYLSAFLYNA